MNNSPEKPFDHAIAVGEKTFLFLKDSVDTYVQFATAATDKQEATIAAEDYVLLHLSHEQAPPEEAMPLAEYLASERLSEADRDALLVWIFGSAAAAPAIARDQTIVRTLLEVASDIDVGDGVAVLYRVTGVDTAILLHSRDVKLDGASALYLGNSSSLETVHVQLSGRLLVQAQAKLRLTAIEADPAFTADKLLVVTNEGLSWLAIQSIVSASAEEFFRRSAKELPDAAQMFYECCRPLRRKLSELYMREALPSAISDPSWAFHLRIDSAYQLPNGYFLSGWYADPEERLIELLVLDHRLDTPDVMEHWQLAEEVWQLDGKRVLAKRFRAFVPGRLDRDPLVVRLKAVLRGDVRQILSGPKASYDTTKVRDAILATIEDRTFSVELFKEVYAPALEPLQRELNERQDVRSQHTFGTRSKRQVSIVVPLYAQLGFIRAQLMAFANDTYIRNCCQIVFALDDPRLVHETRTLLEGYQAWTNLDIELAVLDRNGGYAMANNCAAAIAAGEHIVLLNSDVIPAHPGWIEAAVEQLRLAPGYSVVGPKLLYADDSLQHAGMFFERFPHGFWQNLHYWKGFGRDYAPATTRRIVPAVTGACMILRKADFLDVDGFTSDYISGDYEDSDLCLKLRQRGGHCIYIPEIELYHFERQSMPKIEDGHDRRSTIYNRALHTARWDAVISELMTECA